VQAFDGQGFEQLPIHLDAQLPVGASSRSTTVRPRRWRPT
jgi:hypothetical protein